MKPQYSLYSGHVDWHGTCDVAAGKRRYATRKAAKRAAKQVPRSGRRLDPYPCGEHWHLGHLPPDVVNGEVSRPEHRVRDAEAKAIRRGTR